jgi:outer membrane lipoprotein-sorting protein
MKRALFALISAVFCLSAFAQDGKQDPPKPPDGKGDQAHEMHVRPFPEIWKEIELKQKELKSYKAQIAVSFSDQVADSTTWMKGDLFVKHEEKQPPLLFWRIGNEKRNAANEVELEITQRSFHDGANVTVTDESDPKDLRYWKDSPFTEPRFIAQQILLTGGKDLDKSFEVKTMMDPKLAKLERTISKHLDDRLENKDGSSVDPKAPLPPAENRVDCYTFELIPKDGVLKKEILSIMLKLDAQSFVPMLMGINYADNNRAVVTVTNVTKLEPKEILDKKIFEFELSDKFKKSAD